VTDHVSDLRWDRYLAGELSADETAASLAHAEGCERCGARMRELSAGRDAFTERPIPMTFARAKRGSRRGWIGGAATLVAAAAVLVLVVRSGEPPSEERAKGTGPVLILTGGRDGAMVPLASGDAVHPGDSLQAGYSSTRDGFGAVLSHDGAGQVTSYVPSTGATLAALPAGTDRTFPESTILDAVVGSETLYLVWCETREPLAPLLAQVRVGGDLTVPIGCHTRMVVVEKRR